MKWFEGRFGDDSEPPLGILIDGKCTSFELIYSYLLDVASLTFDLSPLSYVNCASSSTRIDLTLICLPLHRQILSCYVSYCLEIHNKVWESILLFVIIMVPI